MEQDAPNQTIGSGSLKIVPDLSAVEAAMKQIEQMVDSAAQAIRSKVSEAFRTAVESGANELAGLVAKAAELKIELPSEPSPQAPDEIRREFLVPEPNSQQAQAMLNQADEVRWREDISNKMDTIIQYLDEINSRDQE